MLIDDVLAMLPDDLREDDVLLPCEEIRIDGFELAQLLDEILTRRNAKSVTLLGPSEELAVEATAMAESIGVGERLRIAR
jgi:hypothetical protein